MPKKSKNTSAKSNKKSLSKSKKLNKINFRSKYKLRFILFILMFGLIGVYALRNLLAENKYPTASDEFVFQFTQESSPPLVYSDDGNQQQPINMRLTGDGELLCRDNSVVTLKKGKLNSKEISNLYDEILAMNLLDEDINPDSRESVMLPSGYEVLLVNNKDGVIALPSHNSAGEQIELFYKVTERLMRECDKADKGIQKKDIIKVKNPKKITYNPSFTQKIANYFSSKVYAAKGGTKGSGKTGVKGSTITAATYTDTEEANMNNNINNRRASIGLNKVTESSCIKKYARDWAKTMSDSGSIYHSSVVGVFGSDYCNIGDTSWKAAGEIVGRGPDTNSIFNAYMASACHKSVIESYKCTDPSVKVPFEYFNTGTYRNSSGEYFTATLFVGCGGNSTCINAMTGGTTTTPPPPSTSYDNASCSGVSAPTSVTSGQSFSGSANMYNAGTTTWTLGSSNGSWRLGSSNPRDNTTWGTNRVNSSGTVAPGGTASFTISAVAPGVSSTQNLTFSWEMVKEGAYWLKDQPVNPNVPGQVPVCTRTISVSPATTTAVSCKKQINFNTIYASPSTYDGPVFQTTSTSTEDRYYYYKYSNPSFYNHQISSVSPTGGTYSHSDPSGVHGILYDYQAYFNQSSATSLYPRINYHYIYTYQGVLWVKRVNKSTGETTYQQSSGDGPGGQVTDNLTSTEKRNTYDSYVYGPNLNRNCQ